MFRNLSPGAIGISTDFVTSVALAARHGWQGIDLPMDEVAQLAAARSPEAVTALLADAGLRPGGWNIPFDWRTAYTRADLDLLASHAKLAQQLGCTRVSTWLLPFSETLPFRENFQFHVQQLQPIARVLAEYGCAIGLEFIGPRTLREGQRYGFIYSLEGMLCLAAAIGPNAGLLLDCWHWYTSVGTIADLRAMRRADVVYVHVNDAPEGVTVDAQLDQVRRLPATTGVIDLAGFLTLLNELGYDGPVTPEPFESRLATLSPDVACAEASAAMRHAWGVAGL